MLNLREPCNQIAQEGLTMHSARRLQILLIIMLALSSGMNAIGGNNDDSSQSRLDAIKAMQAGNDYVRNRYKCGFAIPRFRGVLQHEWIVIDPSMVQFRDVKLQDLGIKDLDSILAVEQSIHKYAKAHGFATGVWTGHQSKKSGKRVIGVYFINADACSVERLKLPGLNASRDWATIVSEVNRQATLCRPQMVGGFPVAYKGKDVYEVVYLNESYAAVIVD